MDPDQVWAYRARGVDPLTPVRVVRHGQNTPPRVLIHFVDEQMEGREEWVPPARLKVPWTQVEDFIAMEARWEAVHDLSPSNEDYEGRAAEAVFEQLVPIDIASVNSPTGVFFIENATALADLTGLTVEELTGHEVSFESDGAVVAPWPVMLAVVQALARRLPDQVLAEVEKDERKFQHELINGISWGRHSPARDLENERAIVREFDEKGDRQSRELRRQWCGVENVSRWDELAELRKEIYRVGEVAEDAIGVLRRYGHSSDADRLEMELGQTVEMLRVDSE